MCLPSRKNTEAFLVFLLLGTILLMASGTFGLTWDESSYFKFFDSIKSWFIEGCSFDPSTINRHWNYSNYHNPHPPFMKIFGAIFAHLFPDFLPYPTSYRMGNIIFVSGCMALVFRLLSTSFSSVASLAAVIFVCFQPRIFGHLLIAATDSPVAVSWLALTLIAWKLSQSQPLQKRIILRILLFILLGCASATKITGFLVVLPMAAYFLAQKDLREVCWLLAAALYSLLFVAFVFPPDWAHPLSAIAHYLFYPLERPQVPISTFYLGSIYAFHLPWHYFLFMTMVTFPVILLLPLLGLIFVRRLNHYGLFPALLFPTAFWVLIGHLPATPKHDGIRQFVSFYPFLALLSWLGLMSIINRFKQWPRLSKANFSGNLVIFIFCCMLLLQTSIVHPFELSFYNRLIGGLSGAEKRGMEMTYYFEAANQDFIREIDPYLVNGAKVCVEPPWPLLLDSYADHGLLEGEFVAKPLLRNGGNGQKGYLLIFRRLSYIDDSGYQNLTPLLEVTCGGVSLVKFVRLGRP